MKTSILTSVSALALFASPAAAQNNSTVTQGGNGNGATVAQQRSAGSDVSLIEQNRNASGSDNSASVTQTGPNAANSTSSTSNIFQTGSNDKATVKQQAYTPIAPSFRNTSTIRQNGGTGGSTADVEQNGHNASEITQVGDGSEAIVKQGGYADSPPVGGNGSTVTQDGDDQATVNQNASLPTTGVAMNGNYGGNTSTLGQGAGSNEASVTQTGLSATSNVTQANGGRADVTQNGDLQDSTVTQDGASFATVEQNGVDNISTIDQSADGADATVGQTGTGNSASTTQRSAATSNLEQGNFDPASSGNTAEVVQNAAAAGSFSDVNQNGSGNSAAITQNAANQDSFNYTEGTDNSATVTQSAARNVSVLLQNSYYGGNGSAPATGNQAIVDQQAVSTNTFSYVYQDGRDNLADVRLSGAGVAKTRQATSDGYVNNAPAESVVLTIGVNNKAYVEQAADRAAANIYQGVDGGYNLVLPTENNTARITQTAAGDDSRSDILQGGSDNIAESTQSASASQSNITQTGDGNTATANQSNGSNLLSEITQLADGNTATTTQSGFNNTASVTQNSDNNMSTVTQGGTGNTATVTQGTSSMGGTN